MDMDIHMLKNGYGYPYATALMDMDIHMLMHNGYGYPYAYA